MRAWKVKVEVRPWEEGGYIAQVASLQGCWVVAPTVEEALEDLPEVIQMSIRFLVRRGKPLPPELQGWSRAEQ